MKNVQKKLALLILAGLPILSSCELDFPIPDLSTYGSPAGAYPGFTASLGVGYPEFTLSVMNIDSSSLINDSTVLFWASLHFDRDTVMYVQKYSMIRYELKETTPGYLVSVWSLGRINSWNVNDTINFADNNMKPVIISLKFPLDSLKTKTYYSFIPAGDYVTKKAIPGIFSGGTLTKRMP